MTSAIVMAAGSAAIVAFIVIAGIIESRMNKRRPVDDLKAAWDHGHANDLGVLRQCWNSKALQFKAPRSISSVRGGL